MFSRVLVILSAAKNLRLLLSCRRCFVPTSGESGLRMTNWVDSKLLVKLSPQVNPHLHAEDYTNRGNLHVGRTADKAERVIETPVEKDAAAMGVNVDAVVIWPNFAGVESLFTGTPGSCPKPAPPTTRSIATATIMPFFSITSFLCSIATIRLIPGSGDFQVPTCGDLDLPTPMVAPVSVHPSACARCPSEIARVLPVIPRESRRPHD
jgi:hypothetical protein